MCSPRVTSLRECLAQTVCQGHTAHHILNWLSISLPPPSLFLYLSFSPSHFPFIIIFSVETSDGKSHQEEGQLKHLGPDHDALAVRGSYTYLGDDGQTYTVNYVADENGYQPEGAHLPRAIQ